MLLVYPPAPSFPQSHSRNRFLPAPFAPCSSSLDAAREVVLNADRRFRTVRDARLSAFLGAFDAVSGAIGRVYKDLTVSRFHPLGGQATLQLLNREEPFGGEPEGSGVAREWRRRTVGRRRCRQRGTPGVLPPTEPACLCDVCAHCHAAAEEGGVRYSVAPPGKKYSEIHQLSGALPPSPGPPARA
jgi:chromosome segregation ATPase